MGNHRIKIGLIKVTTRRKTIEFEEMHEENNGQ